MKTVFMGAAALVGAAVAGYGAYSLISDFSSASQPTFDSVGRFATKASATLIGAGAGGFAGGVLGMFIHKDQELEALRFMAFYAVIGGLLGGVGGYKVGDDATTNTQDHSDAAYSIEAPTQNTIPNFTIA